MLGTGSEDATSGFRAYRADTLKAIDYASTHAMGYGFQIETQYRICWWGGKIVETPIVFTDRETYSKMTWGIFAEELLLVTWWGVRDRFRRLQARRRRGDGGQRPTRRLQPFGSPGGRRRSAPAR